MRNSLQILAAAVLPLAATAQQTPTDVANEIAALVAQGDAESISRYAAPTVQSDLSTERIAAALSALRTTFGSIRSLKLLQSGNGTAKIGEGKVDVSAARYRAVTTRCPDECVLEITLTRDDDTYRLWKFVLLKKVLILPGTSTRPDGA